MIAIIIPILIELLAPILAAIILRLIERLLKKAAAEQQALTASDDTDVMFAARLVVLFNAAEKSLPAFAFGRRRLLRSVANVAHRRSSELRDRAFGRVGVHVSLTPLRYEERDSISRAESVMESELAGDTGPHMIRGTVEVSIPSADVQAVKYQTLGDASERLEHMRMTETQGNAANASTTDPRTESSGKSVPAEPSVENTEVTGNAFDLIRRLSRRVANLETKEQAREAKFVAHRLTGGRLEEIDDENRFLDWYEKLYSAYRRSVASGVDDISMMLDAVTKKITQPYTPRGIDNAMSDTDRKPAKVFPLREYVRNELKARGWRIVGNDSHMYFVPQFIAEVFRGVPLTTDTVKSLVGMFGASEEFWKRLEASSKPNPSATPRNSS